MEAPSLPADKRINRPPFAETDEICCNPCRGQDAVDKHVRRVRSSLPKEGSVRTLQVTDKQYGRMELMLGNTPKTELVGTSQMVLL